MPIKSRKIWSFTELENKNGQSFLEKMSIDNFPQILDLPRHDHFLEALSWGDRDTKLAQEFEKLGGSSIIRSNS